MFQVTIQYTPQLPISVPKESDKPLLVHLESANIAAEYQCREGHCGSCRCKLISGTVDYQIEPLAYLAPNDILPCIAIVKSDIEIKGLSFADSNDSHIEQAK